MKVWDMHCDTLAELRYAQQAGKPKSFLHNDLMMDLERMKQGDYLLQCMACFVHLEPEREKSRYRSRNAPRLSRQAPPSSTVSIMPRLPEVSSVWMSAAVRTCIRSSGYCSSRR